MKATLDLPDELYRQVKARSALEGRPIRAVAVQLFQNWLNAKPVVSSPPTTQDYEDAPWLAITQQYLQPGMTHDLADIREAIARGWAVETAEKQSS